MPEFTLRQATRDDLDFLDLLNTVCMKDHVEQLMPWQSDLFKKTFNPNLVRVVVVDGTSVGMLKVRVEESCLYLGDIMILPKYQNLGLGRELIKLVESEASQLQLPLRLKVLSSNPAKNLYTRLGFKVIEKDEFYYRMEKADVSSDLTV